MVESRRWDDYIKDNYPWLAQKVDIIGKVELSIADEAKAGPEYRKLADLLREENFIGYAEEIEKIASDEDRHLEILKQIKKGLGEVEKAEEITKKEEDGETSSPVPAEWVQEIQRALDGWRDAVFIQEVEGVLKDKSTQKISRGE